MNVYIYSLIENGYKYETGTIEAVDTDSALEAASALAKPGTRDTYSPDDDSTIEVTHGVVVTADDGNEAKTTVTFEVTCEPVEHTGQHTRCGDCQEHRADEAHHSYSEEG